MSDHINPNILLVGASQMAQDYVNVLKEIKSDFTVVGRGLNSARNFEKLTGVKVITGGLSQFLSVNSTIFDHAIVAVGVEELAKTTIELLEAGIKKILVEKPAGLNIDDINAINIKANKKNADVVVAYNRRYYSSVIKAKEIIENDGGINSFNFEFTEWSHIIKDASIKQRVKQNWLLANSSHVLDLAFYLGGNPIKLCSYSHGKLDWHTKAVFAGAGITDKEALFTYHANWDAPGRWAVEFLTKKHRLILKPLEELFIQQIGSVSIEKVALDDKLDHTFKPGLYKQIIAFLPNNASGTLLSIQEHVKKAEIYQKILEGSEI